MRENIIYRDEARDRIMFPGLAASSHGLTRMLSWWPITCDAWPVTCHNIKPTHITCDISQSQYNTQFIIWSLFIHFDNIIFQTETYLFCHIHILTLQIFSFIKKILFKSNFIDLCVNVYFHNRGLNDNKNHDHSLSCEWRVEYQTAVFLSFTGWMGKWPFFWDSPGQG